MRARRKHQLILGLILAGLAVGTVFWLIRQPPLPPASAPLRLPDGSSVSVMTTTYGTRHRIGPWLGHIADRMPVRIRVLMFRLAGSSASLRFSADTAEPTLLVWVLRTAATTNATPVRDAYTCQLANAAGDFSSEKIHYVGYPLEHVGFKVFPRRDQELNLHFFERGTNGPPRDCGQLTFPNPRFGRFFK